MFRWVLDRAGKAVTAPERFPMLFEPDTSGELVALDTATSDLHPQHAEIVAIAAVKIRGNRVLTSQRFAVTVKPKRPVDPASIRVHQFRPVDVAAGLDVETAIERLIAFIGSRPLVGYYLEFDVAVVNRALLDIAGIALPNRQIEVSALYYDVVLRRSRALRLYGRVDLRFDTLRRELGLPPWPRHDPTGNAVTAALMYLKIRDIEARRAVASAGR